MKRRFLLIFALVVSSASLALYGQTKDPSPFDYGRMWTFENPPKDWFAKAYDFAPEDQWYDDVRQASLRFASWCSASFVSPDGLIMTNHHCSRSVVGALQQEGEVFDQQAFYAPTRADERKAQGLFVEQLIQVADITDDVLSRTANAENDAHALELRAKALEDIQAKYAEMDDWKGLRLQTVTYYSGGKFSLYGYKRYDDIRLVFLPELDLGFYGGDPDNFTYPRYNLDCTFWRAYDENGQPVNSSENYFKFNPDGIHDGEPVFVVGNPGSTERYRTVSQLEYDRDYRYPMQLKFMTNRHALLQKEYEANPTDQMLNTIFGLSNSMKAIGGIVGGLRNDELFGRKVAMEKLVRTKSPGVTHWNDLAESYAVLEPHAWAISHLGPSGLRGNALLLMHALHQYEQQIADGASEEELQSTKESIIGLGGDLDNDKQRKYFRVLLNELKEDVYPGDPTMVKLLDGKSVDEYIAHVFKKTRFTDAKKAAKCLDKTKKVKKDKDPFLQASRLLIPKYNDAVAAFSGSSPYRRGLESKIANQVFNVYGTSLPPDATFTLRISDGLVKGYDYNGTQAPYKTTYFGMYDRHYSNDTAFPWSLPEKWQNPSMDLLKAPINFVSTNDIIGGNSGSPVINRNKEAVGLIFDGNIESLPGNFIFDDEVNRSVSVHVGGIVAALKHVYGAERLVIELLGK